MTKNTAEISCDCRKVYLIGITSIKTNQGSITNQFFITTVLKCLFLSNHDDTMTNELCKYSTMQKHMHCHKKNVYIMPYTDPDNQVYRQQEVNNMQSHLQIG